MRTKLPNGENPLEQRISKLSSLFFDLKCSGDLGSRMVGYDRNTNCSSGFAPLISGSHAAELLRVPGRGRGL